MSGLKLRVDELTYKIINYVPLRKQTVYLSIYNYLFKIVNWHLKFIFDKAKTIIVSLNKNYSWPNSLHAHHKKAEKNSEKTQ